MILNTSTYNFTQALGKTGKIIKIYSDGDLRVALDGHTWTFNPLSVSLMPPGSHNVPVINEEADRNRDRSGIILMNISGGGKEEVNSMNIFVSSYSRRDR